MPEPLFPLLALRRTLLAIDGTVLGPDMLPVPGGFSLNPSGKLLRPNGKPVPMGVFVGKEFILLTPYGKPLPDGELRMGGLRPLAVATCTEQLQNDDVGHSDMEQDIDRLRLEWLVG